MLPGLIFHFGIWFRFVSTFLNAIWQTASDFQRRMFFNICGEWLHYGEGIVVIRQLNILVWERKMVVMVKWYIKERLNGNGNTHSRTLSDIGIWIPLQKKISAGGEYSLYMMTSCSILLSGFCINQLLINRRHLYLQLLPCYFDSNCYCTVYISIFYFYFM